MLPLQGELEFSQKGQFPISRVWPERYISYRTQLSRTLVQRHRYQVVVSPASALLITIDEAREMAIMSKVSTASIALHLPDDQYNRFLAEMLKKHGKSTRPLTDEFMKQEAKLFRKRQSEFSRLERKAGKIVSELGSKLSAEEKQSISEYVYRVVKYRKKMTDTEIFETALAQLRKDKEVSMLQNSRSRRILAKYETEIPDTEKPKIQRFINLVLPRNNGKTDSEIFAAALVRYRNSENRNQNQGIMNPKKRPLDQISGRDSTPEQMPALDPAARASNTHMKPDDIQATNLNVAGKVPDLSDSVVKNTDTKALIASSGKCCISIIYHYR